MTGASPAVGCLGRLKLSESVWRDERVDLPLVNDQGHTDEAVDVGFRVQIGDPVWRYIEIHKLGESFACPDECLDIVETSMKQIPETGVLLEGR